MVKRAIAAVLWFNAMYVAGAAMAYAMDLPSLTAPLLAIASAIFVGFDPRHLFWHRAAPKPAGAATDATMEQSPTTA